MEQWKSVIGYELYYEVSDLGNVRSLDRKTITGAWGSYNKKGKLLTTQNRPNGYKIITLMVGKGSKKCALVHRLVAESFIGPSLGLVVDHIDGDRSNNKLSNLEYVTMRENICRGGLSESRPNKKCASRGVTVSKWNRYISSVRVKGKSIYLGSFGTEEEAASAYKKAVADIENQ